MHYKVSLERQINLKEKIIFVNKRENSKLAVISRSFEDAVEISSVVNAWIIANQGSLSNTRAIIIELEENNGAQLKDISDLVSQAEKMSIPIVVYAPEIDETVQNDLIKSGVSDVRTDYFDAETFNNWIVYDSFLKLNKDQPATKTPVIRRYRIGIRKRVFDILVSSFLLVVLFPAMALIALVIKLESKGSIFYVSKRAGRGYKIFNFYKFRSMRSGADKEVEDLWHRNEYSGDSEEKAVFFKVKDDPRITKFGSFIRSTSLDELPQLLNVLKGDMSIVGNRPLPLYEASQLTNDQISVRFLAPAGITGLWQVTKRGKAELTPEERIQLDIDYANNYSFSYDLYILFKTFPALMQQEKV